MSYKTHVLRTLRNELTNKELLGNVGLGLSGEAGEVADLIKKHLYHGHDLNKEKLINELGDVRWYLEVAAHAIGTTVEEIEAKNVEKLEKRYPNGFSKEASINRKA